jgi:hypothetical protein
MPPKTKPKPSKSKHGGPRPGSGRPRTKALKQTISNILIAKLEKMAESELIPAIEELVRGISVQQHDKKGNTRIYLQPPNPQMVIYLADRILGKTPNRTIIDGGTDDAGDIKPIPLRIISE